MTDSREPFEELDTLVERLNRQFEELGRAFESDASAGSDAPAAADIPVDIAETDAAVILTADLPGVDSAAIDLRVDRESLTLRVDPPEDDVDADAEYHRRERRHEPASRTLSLPTAVDASAASATHATGVLTVRLPKPDDDSPAGYQIDVS